MFYVLVLGTPILFSLCIGKLDKDRRKHIHCLITIIMGIMLAMRKNVGADYNNYKTYYEIYLNRAIPSHPFNDKGYNTLNHLLGFLGVPFSVFLFVIGVFTVYSFYRYLEESETISEIIPTTLYFLIFDIFVYSLSAIRQSISIACMLFAIISYNKGKNVKGLFLLSIGATFHWTTLFMIPVIFLANRVKNVKISILLALIPLTSILYYLFMRSPLLNRLASINYNLTLYLIYQRDETIATGRFDVIIYALLAAAWIFFFVFFEEMDGTAIHLKHIRHGYVEMKIEDWMVYLFFLSKVWLIIQYNVALPRIQMYLYFLLPYTFGKLTDRIKGYEKMIVFIVVFVLLVFSFMSKLNVNYAAYGYASF